MTNSAIHRPRVAHHQPPLTDGLEHPVTVRYTTPRHRATTPSSTPLTDRLAAREQSKLQTLTLADVATLVDAPAVNVFCIECGDNHAVGFCPDCGACDYTSACWNCGPSIA